MTPSTDGPQGPVSLGGRGVRDILPPSCGGKVCWVCGWSLGDTGCVPCPWRFLTPFPRGRDQSSPGLCAQIREEIDHYGIRIYQFPECDSDEDEEFKLQDQALKVGWAPAAPGPWGAHRPWCQAQWVWDVSHGAGHLPELLPPAARWDAETLLRAPPPHSQGSGAS